MSILSVIPGVVGLRVVARGPLEGLVIDVPLVGVLVVDMVPGDVVTDVIVQIAPRRRDAVYLLVPLRACLKKQGRCAKLTK